MLLPTQRLLRFKLVERLRCLTRSPSTAICFCSSFLADQRFSFLSYFLLLQIALSAVQRPNARGTRCTLTRSALMRCVASPTADNTTPVNSADRTQRGVSRVVLQTGAVLLLAIYVSAAFATTAGAAVSTYTWSGGTSGSWDTTSATWTFGTGTSSTTPWNSTNGPADDGTFQTANAAITVNAAVFANTITFKAATTLNQNTGGTGSITLGDASANAPLITLLSGDPTVNINAPDNRRRFHGRHDDQQRQYSGAAEFQRQREHIAWGQTNRFWLLGRGRSISAALGTHCRRITSFKSLPAPPLPSPR